MQSYPGSAFIGKPMPPFLLLDRKEVRTCHVLLPDDPKPVSAIQYHNRFYSYLKFYPTVEPAQRAAKRLIGKGEAVILTPIPKGLILWVFEPDAQLAKR
jgi:hypothetical protein